MIGGSGVHLFILLSGFGLGLSSQKLPLLSFYKKRFTKILLPYYLTITIIFILNIQLAFYPDDGLYAYMGHLFLFKMFDTQILGSFGTHFWFLSTIIQLYLVFPLIIQIKKRMSNIIFIAGSIAISILFWCLLSIFSLTENGILSSSLFQFLWEFNLGLVLADLYKHKKFVFWNIHPVLLIVATIFGFLIMSYMALHGGKWGVVFNDIPASIGFFSLSALIFKFTDRILPILKSSLLFIGRISFALYLIHIIIFLICIEIITQLFTFNPNLYIALGCILPFTILLTWLYHQLLNRILHR